MTGSDDQRVGSADTSPFREVDSEEWRGLIERGREQGNVHAEDVALVLREVELTGDVLDQVQHVLADEGIELDETIDEADEVDDGEDADGPPIEPPRIQHDEADEHLLSRRRRRRTRRASPRGDAGTRREGGAISR